LPDRQHQTNAIRLTDVLSTHRPGLWNGSCGLSPKCILPE